MMKSKGYSKGGAKMMKAKKGKMAKGYAKGGAKMMKAKGGKMAKGYSKGAVMKKAMQTARAREEGGRFSLSDLRLAAKTLGYTLGKKTGKKTPPGPALFTKKKK